MTVYVSNFDVIWRSCLATVTYVTYVTFRNTTLGNVDVKDAQAWDIRSLEFSWFLRHKVFMGRWFGGKNINLLF